MSAYALDFTKRAEVNIMGLDASIRARVKVAIETKLTVDPFRFGKSLSYSEHHLHSLRVGDWRVLYKIVGVTVVILTVRHRKQWYDDLG